MSASGMGALVVVGGGRMGEALASGLLAHGWPPGRLAVVEASPARRAELAGTSLTVVATLDEGLGAVGGAGGDGPGGDGPAGAVDAAGAVGAVIAVKPHDVEAVSHQLASAGVARALSIAAGVNLADLDRWLDPAVALRAMPNTPALVGAGASAVAAGASAGPEDEEWAAGLLSATGRVVRLPERLLDAVTGLSGSGPAYVFLVAEALIDAGVAAGLPRDASTILTIQTLLGAARLLDESGQGPEALRAMVTSPGGTTAAGLRVLESRAVRAALIDAVAAATDRSRELGAG